MNCNESLNSLLSDIVPKKCRAGYYGLKLGAALAVIRFNDGYNAVHNIFASLHRSGLSRAPR